MCWQAKGLYRELLDEFWAEGFLPVDHEELSVICGCTVAEFETYWPQIKGSWEETPEGLVNAKMDSQRTATDSARVTNAKNGKAGAIAKLANASTPPADAKQSPSERHIEEQSKEEQSIRRGKKKSSRDKREVDPRHEIFREEIKAYAIGKGVLFVWDPSEAKQLALLLKSVPELQLEDFKKCLQHRARSPGTPHGERPRVWLPNILKYQEGPLDQFGKHPASNGGNNGKPDRGKAIAESTNATIAIRRARSVDAEQDSDGGGAHPITTARSLFERPNAQLVAKNPG